VDRGDSIQKKDTKKRQQKIFTNEVRRCFNEKGFIYGHRSISGFGGVVLVAIPSQSADLKRWLWFRQKDVKGEAKGKLTINTANGTDLEIQITGLDPKGLYTAFFVNVKSQMFEGIGPAPHTLKVNEKGEADFKGTMKKTSTSASWQWDLSQPAGKPIGNPVGVKAALGSLVATDKPKLILEGKLR